jgi:hypothetical protein
VTILARIKEEDTRFKEAMVRVFEEKATEFPERTLTLLQKLWMDGVHHGHELRLTEAIIKAIERKGRFDSTTGIFELDTDGPIDTHE